MRWYDWTIVTSIHIITYILDLLGEHNNKTTYSSHEANCISVVGPPSLCHVLTDDCTDSVLAHKFCKKCDCIPTTVRSTKIFWDSSLIKGMPNLVPWPGFAVDVYCNQHQTISTSAPTNYHQYLASNAYQTSWRIAVQLEELPDDLPSSQRTPKDSPSNQRGTLRSE